MQLIESIQKTMEVKSIVLMAISSLFVGTTALAGADSFKTGFTPQDSADATASTSQSADKADGTDEVVDEFGAFEIAVEDVPLPQVLNMLAIQSRRNIITSKRVGSVSITANLFDVTFYEALDSILHIASLCYDEQGNFIYVMTCEEKLQRERAGRKLEDRVYYLDHISPLDAELLAKPLLSSDGTMSKLGEVQSGFAPGKTDAGNDEWAHEPVLVVRDYTDNLEAINTLLKDVDTPPKQVMVESTILVTKSEGDYAWGMDVSVLLKANFQSLINPLNPVGWLQNVDGQQMTKGQGTPSNNAIGVQSTVGNTKDAGGFKFGILNDNVGVFLRLLDDVSDTMILARPKILALNRQRAQVLVGERVAYLSTTQTETATTQAVQFLDTGINLILRPFISRDNSIRMELYPSVSEYRLRTIGDGATLGFTTVPDEITNEITTNVRVRDGETVVLGGLFKDKAVTSRKSVPGLGDVPVLGAAFQGQDDKVERQEIIFLVTPTVVQEEVMDDASKEANELVRDIAVGVREGLLPWAREKMAANYNHDAHTALKDGDTDRAISFINRSLRNDPNQPEIVRLRANVLGERSIYSQDGDVLEKIFERTFRRSVGEEESDVVYPTSDPLSQAPSMGGTDATHDLGSEYFADGDPFAESDTPDSHSNSEHAESSTDEETAYSAEAEQPVSEEDSQLTLASSSVSDGQESVEFPGEDTLFADAETPTSAEFSDALPSSESELATADQDASSAGQVDGSDASLAMDESVLAPVAESSTSEPVDGEIDQPLSAETQLADSEVQFNAFTQTDYRTAFMTWWTQYTTALSQQTENASSIATAEED